MRREIASASGGEETNRDFARSEPRLLPNQTETFHEVNRDFCESPLWRSQGLRAFSDWAVVGFELGVHDFGINGMILCILREV